MLQLYDGGGRSAIFSTGVADGLEAAGAKKPDVLIANSAGIVSLLTIATGPSGKGLELFNRFITENTLHKKRLFRTLVSNLLHRVAGTPSRRKDMVLDVPAALNILEDHGFDLETLRTSSIACFVRVFDVHKGVCELIDLGESNNVWNAILQTCCYEPYYRAPVSTGRIDPMIYGTKGYAEARGRFPEQQIVAVENFPAHSVDSLRGYIANVLHGFFSMNEGMMEAYASRDRRLLREREFVERQGDSIIVVRPPDDFPVTSGTNVVTPLRKGYDMGRRAADNLLPVLERQGLV